jgi:hypothetical protein
MKKVFVAQHPTEAHLVAGLLSSQGIPAEVQGEALFTARGEVPVTPATLPSVWVLEDGQADDALQILSEQRQDGGAAASADRAPWTCAQCGESVEGQFTVCWKCGAARERA